MKIYWSISSVPELAALQKNTRIKIWRECHRAVFRKPLTWLALGFCCLCTFEGGTVGERHGLGGAGALLGGLIGAFVFSQVVTRLMLPTLRAAAAKST